MSRSRQQKGAEVSTKTEEEKEATAELKFIPFHETSPIFLWFTGSRAWGQFHQSNSRSWTGGKGDRVIPIQKVVEITLRGYNLPDPSDARTPPQSMNASVHESLRRAAPFRSAAVAAIRRLLKFRIISLVSEGRRPDAGARELRDSECGVEPLQGCFKGHPLEWQARPCFLL